uniref:Peptidase S1 domain-containing protein n=1 Tax=Otus sunia TaxID=257818 RepID=A0A8C8AK88_9STRI
EGPLITCCCETQFPFSAFFFFLFCFSFPGDADDDKVWEATNCPEHSVPYWCPLNVGYHFCGGSLISNQWVLSADHWQHSLTLEHSELVRSAALIIYHPRYNSGSLDNDIMLIKMATTMDYSADIQLTALLSSSANFPMCQEAYPGEITSNMICVGFLDGGKGYDSGPAVCIGKLQGIVSWENEYALKGYPSVYTKVCNYVDRIKQIIAA